MSQRPPLAKISPPRLFGVLPRDRLFTVLDQNHDRPLIWISGPPGAGKTTLVAGYVRERERPALWYQIESGDADPATLFHYLGALIDAAAPRAGPVLPRFAPEHHADLGGFARVFFRAFFARVPPGALLVFDNFQEAPTDLALDRIVSIAATEAPASISVWCVSRSETPVSLVPLAATGMLFSLPCALLPLTLDETRQIAAARDVRDEALVHALHQRSEGWAAGITLMLERLAFTSEGGTAQDLIPRESVFNYFASLLFDHVSEATRHVLMSVAFLPRVSPTMARTLSGCADAADVLDQLYRRHLFTDRRMGTEPVYQFHALFREFLQTQARERMGLALVVAVVERSAYLLESAGQREDAVELWILSERWDALTAIVLRDAQSLLSGGRRQTLEQWIQALPSQMVDAHPWLQYWLGMAQAETLPNIAVTTLEGALNRFQAVPDHEGQVLCLTALLNTSFVGYAGLHAMDTWLDALLSQMERVASFSEPDVELRVWGVLCSALFWIRPWHPWTSSAAQRVETLLPHARDPDVALAAAASALATTCFSGTFECGDRIAEITRSWAEDDDASPSQSVWWLVQAGFLAFFETQYDRAIDLTNRACQIAEAHGMSKTFSIALVHRCAMELRISGWRVAGPTLRQLESLLSGSRFPMYEVMVRLLQSRHALSRGQGDAAADMVEETDRLTLTIGSRYQEMLFGLIEAELLLATARVERARQLLARSRATIDRSPALDCWRAALAILEAWHAQLDGDAGGALAALRDGLALAKPGHRWCYLRHFDVCTRHMFSLALTQGIEAEFVRYVIRAFRLKPPLDAPDDWHWPVRIYTLGRFEVLIDGDPLVFTRKFPRKTLLLLKAIVAFGGKDVGEQTLCDALWSDEEGDAARNALSITVLRLRKLLGSNDAILQRGGCIALNPEVCWVDSLTFEAHALDQHSSHRDPLALYGGVFLPGDEDVSWSVFPRERLREKFTRALSARGTAQEGQSNIEGALVCYLRGIDADPIVESHYLGVMRCYDRLGKPTEALSTYRRLKHTLSVVLGVPPTQAATHLANSIIARQVAGAYSTSGTEGVDASRLPSSPPARRVHPMRHTPRAKPRC